MINFRTSLNQNLKMYLLLILVFGFLINCSAQDIGTFNAFSLKLYHNLGSNQQYVPRGSIAVQYHRNIIGNFVQDNPLTDSELNNLKQLCRQNQHYSIRTVLNDNLRSSETFVLPCSFINSGLIERLVVNLDFNGEFLSLSSHTDNNFCSDLDNIPLTTVFNTTVFVMQTTSAPIPDTQTYIHRLEMERKEKLKGEGQDNRSFLAKYWIYIVPISILLLISSASNQEGS